MLGWRFKLNLFVTFFNCIDSYKDTCRISLDGSKICWFYIVNATVILTNESYYIFKASKKEKEKVKRLTLDINKRLQEDT